MASCGRGYMSRVSAEAIRRLVELGLKAAPTGKVKR